VIEIIVDSNIININIINNINNYKGVTMKKFLSVFLTLALLLTLFPLTALASEPFSLEAPKNLTGELKIRDDGIPYFELKLTVPESVKTINSNLVDNPDYYDGISCDGIEIIFDYKYGNYDWNEGPSLYWNTSMAVSDYLELGAYEYEPFDEGDFDTVDIKNEVYQFRARFNALWGYQGDWIDKDIYSEYSNIVTIGNPAFYDDASDWAVVELEKANEAGLIPDILKGKDLTKSITREEFAELALLLYEKTTDKTVASVSENPFTDTTNPQIVKAFSIGITQGTSATTFSPNELINREQCATMLFRTIKAIEPEGDFSIEGVKDFPDQADISSWAVEGTKFMAKLGIIKGDSNGNFMPKAVTDAQKAVGYGMASREAAILMSVRTYEEYK
jgi:hypothetical protein